MMRETRVNLKHLLEDIRDGYTIPLPEVIVVELIANSLDSGASQISFFTDKAEKTLTAVDNGKGMKRQEMADYHNIAATTKMKGRGIGFAGVGAKLSLLLASSVLTETKSSYGRRCATEWYLKNETSAPWKFVPCSGKVPHAKGTAVVIHLQDSNCSLLSEEFVARSAFRNFYPLFDPQNFQLILKHIYKKGVKFSVNNRELSFPSLSSPTPRVFQIRLGGKSRKLAGCGYVTKLPDPVDLAIQGLGVSTFGKVIKSGWEWIGIGPKEDGKIYGMIEIPALAEILTTNKMDFLKDATSLRKYYRYRKAIQETILPILKDFGEELAQEQQKKQFRFLSRDIERALRGLVGDFPELAPLLGIRRLSQKEGFESDEEPRLVGIMEEKMSPKTGKVEEEKERLSATGKDAPESSENKSLSNGKKKGKKGPALTIGFENKGEKEGLARMIENKIWINTSHPAYFKAQQKKLEQYHILFCVGLVLSNFLEDNRSPQAFIDNFLACWGKDLKRTTQLLKI